VYVHKKHELGKSRALAIDTGISWDEFLHLLVRALCSRNRTDLRRPQSQKFMMHTTHVALEVGTQLVEIDDIGAVHVMIAVCASGAPQLRSLQNEDWLVIDGLSIDDDNDASNNTGTKNSRSPSSAVATTSTALSGDVAPALLGLTNALARLTHRLETYTERLDAAQQRTVQQHEQVEYIALVVVVAVCA
jgi:hypothetical protein